jgi:hypothetical protein
VNQWLLDSANTKPRRSCRGNRAVTDSTVGSAKHESRDMPQNEAQGTQVAGKQTDSELGRGAATFCAWITSNVLGVSATPIWLRRFSAIADGEKSAPPEIFVLTKTFQRGNARKWITKKIIRYCVTTVCVRCLWRWHIDCPSWTTMTTLAL